MGNGNLPKDRVMTLFFDNTMWPSWVKQMVLKTGFGHLMQEKFNAPTRMILSLTVKDFLMLFTQMNDKKMNDEMLKKNFDMLPDW